jgi:hypothetical protein
MIDFNRLLSALPLPAAKSRSFDFGRLLNWKLLQGSHVFPGPDGGTCINEAAIVAAGFPYRRVQSVADLPSSFSLPIANYAMGLNDCISDDALRQELLMPFVTRLAGSADTMAIETRRTELIVRRSVTDLLPLALEAFGFHDEAARCRSAKTVSKAIRIANDLVAAFRACQPENEAEFAMADALAHTARAIEHYTAGDTYHAAGVAAGIPWRVANALEKFHGAGRNAARELFFRTAAAILDDALRTGKQADPIGADVAGLRMEEAKREAAAWRNILPETVD